MRTTAVVIVLAATAATAHAKGPMLGDAVTCVTAPVDRVRPGDTVTFEATLDPDAFCARQLDFTPAECLRLLGEQVGDLVIELEADDPAVAYGETRWFYPAMAELDGDRWRGSVTFPPTLGGTHLAVHVSRVYTPPADAAPCVLLERGLAIGDAALPVPAPAPDDDPTAPSTSAPPDEAWGCALAHTPRGASPGAAAFALLAVAVLAIRCAHGLRAAGRVLPRDRRRG